MRSLTPPFVRASHPPPPFATSFLVAADAHPNSGRASPRVAAALIDTGFIDTTLIELIEHNGLEITKVLITHDHPAHTHGLTTIARAYGPRIFAGRDQIAGIEATPLEDGERIDVGDIQLETIALYGDAGEVLAFRLDDLLFPGPAISAGEVGVTTSAEAAARQQQALRERVATLPGHTRILTSHGPPTTVALEIAFNPAFRSTPPQPATPGTDQVVER